MRTPNQDIPREPCVLFEQLRIVLQMFVCCEFGVRLLLPIELRRRHLWRSKCFECDCERCAAEELHAAALCSVEAEEEE